MSNKLLLIAAALLAGSASVRAGLLEIQPVPETGTTIVLLGVGLGAVVALRRKLPPRK